MARKITTSPMMDQPLMGSFNMTTNTLSTLGTDENIILDPNGNGIIELDGNVQIRNQGDLRLLESSGNGTNYIAMQAAANMASNYTITWPATVSATNGFFLSSDTSGNLSWSSAAGGISVADPGSTATVHYPIFGTNAGAVPTSFAPNARSNLSFVPSTGTLIASIFQGAVDGSASGSGTLTIRGTSSGTKASASVLMTDNVASTTTTTGTLVVTGGVGISGQVTAATVVETSSIAFKENINPIENALDKIMQLVGVEYDRKDTKEHESGLIAEHVYMILPDLVSCDENGKPYGLKYTKITAYLVEAIKELKQEITKLKS